MNSRTIHTDNEIDLTEAFALVSSGEITSKDVENYILGLLGELYETATDPLCIQIEGNMTKLKHIPSIHENQKKSRAKRRNAAIIVIEEMIENSVYAFSAPVNLEHNTSIKTLKRKTNEVIEYVYFDSPAIIRNSKNVKHYNIRITTERIKGQDPNLLDLYYITVNKKEPSDRNSNVALPQGSINS